MVAFKDLFSEGASAYARFRPSYPEALFDWLAGAAPARALAADVGTGNGQAAVALAARFDRVVAIDPSHEQLRNAAPCARVVYRQAAAEALPLARARADLLVSAQAFHWFRADAFFAEAGRVLRPGGLLALWCYGLASITPAVDALVSALYGEALGRFWDPERRLIEEGYRSVRAPSPEIEAPAFAMTAAWSLAHLGGYLGTWSALKKCVRETGQNPLEALWPRLEEAWGAVERRPVRWPLSLRAFRI